jgi:type I restriction enzyme S subunit
MMEERTTPMNWVINRLGDFVYYQKGKKPKSVSNIKTISHSIPYVNIKAFEKGIIDEFTDGDGCVLCEQGDFLMVWDGARSGYIGRSLKGALGSTLVKIQFPGVNLDYAYFYLQSKYLEINTRAKGTGIPHVDPELVWNYNFPLPPLAEQQRIVAKIEELFSELDKGIETLKTAQQQLKVYRQAVLKYAFEGKLTNPEVKEGVLPEGWKMTTLHEVTSKITDGEHFRPKTTTSGIPFLSAKDVRDNGVSFHNPLFIDKETAAKALQRCCPTTGDILIVSRGATVGRMCLVNTDQTFCLLGSVILLKVDKSIFNKYLLFLLKSASINQKIISVSGATAQQAIYLRDIKGIEILLPPMDEQVKIVDEIELRLSVCDKIEESIEQGLQQAEALRQSILKKAFEGKLVPQDSKDEPASVLLERIKAERAAQPEKKSRTKQKI